jgi:hypothetical protein
LGLFIEEQATVPKYPTSIAALLHERHTRPVDFLFTDRVTIAPETFAELLTIDRLLALTRGTGERFKTVLPSPRDGKAGWHLVEIEWSAAGAIYFASPISIRTHHRED